MVYFLVTFLEDFQKLPVPICALTYKIAVFKWTLKCQDVVDKRTFDLTPILQMPDNKSKFDLSYTSKLADGGLLYQYQEDIFYVIGYHWKLLKAVVYKS